MAETPKIILPERMNTPAEDAAKANLRAHAQEARDGLAKIDSAKAAQEEAARATKAAQTAEAADRASKGVAERAATERAEADAAKPKGLVERMKNAVGVKKPDLTSNEVNSRLEAASKQGREAVDAAKNSKSIQIANGVGEGPKHPREFLEQSSKQARAELDAMKGVKPEASAKAGDAAKAADKAAERIAAKAAAEKAAEGAVKTGALQTMKNTALSFLRAAPLIGTGATAIVGAFGVKDRLEAEDGHGAAVMAGSTAGAITGAIAGAAIGSAVPIVGTAIGGVIGATVGLFGGAAVGNASDAGKDYDAKQAAIRAMLKGPQAQPPAPQVAPVPAPVASAASGAGNGQPAPAAPAGSAPGTGAAPAPAPSAPGASAPDAGRHPAAKSGAGKAAPAAGNAGEIVIQKDDSLSKIAQNDDRLKEARAAVEKALGTKDKLTVTLVLSMALAAANEVEKPDLIQPGKKLDIGKTMGKIDEVAGKMKLHPTMKDDGKISGAEFGDMQNGLKGKTTKEILEAGR